MSINRHANRICAAGISLLAACGFTSCGEDRTYEFEEKTQETHWIYDVMRQYYFWYAEMPDVSDYKVFFKETETFFKSLLSSKDKYSYMEVAETEEETRSINQKSSYGFDFALYIDPVTQSQSNTRRYARVLYVLPSSPASEAGLKRGDWISLVGGEEVTSKNYEALISGGATTLTTTTLNYDRLDSLYWEQKADTLTLSAARKVEDNPFYVDSVYHIGGRKIAYLMYNRFSTGPEDTGSETQYGDEMKQIFARFKGSQVTDFILDLRYNPGGYLSCAQELASLICPQEVLGNEVFCALRFNDKQTSRNEELPFDQSLTGDANLNMGKVYVITSNLTASASESIINGLNPVMGKENVVMVGTRTEGKNVASLTFTSSYGFTLHPIVAQVFNGRVESDYSGGFAPTHEVDELQYVNPWKPLGDINEIMLNATLAVILDGGLSGQTVTRGLHTATLPSPVAFSISHKYPGAALLDETIHIDDNFLKE